MCPRGSGPGQDHHPFSAWCPVTQNLPANQQPLCILPLMQAPCLSIHSGSMAAFTVCASSTHCKHSRDSLHSPFSLCENKEYLLVCFQFPKKFRSSSETLLKCQEGKSSVFPDEVTVTPWRGSQIQSKSLLVVDSLLSGVWARWRGVLFRLRGLTRQQILKYRHTA